MPRRSGQRNRSSKGRSAHFGRKGRSAKRSAQSRRCYRSANPPPDDILEKFADLIDLIDYRYSFWGPVKGLTSERRYVDVQDTDGNLDKDGLAQVIQFYKGAYRVTLYHIHWMHELHTDDSCVFALHNGRMITSDIHMATKLHQLEGYRAKKDLIQILTLDMLEDTTITAMLECYEPHKDQELGFLQQIHIQPVRCIGPFYGKAVKEEWTQKREDIVRFLEEQEIKVAKALIMLTDFSKSVNCYGAELQDGWWRKSRLTYEQIKDIVPDETEASYRPTTNHNGEHFLPHLKNIIRPIHQTGHKLPVGYQATLFIQDDRINAGELTFVTLGFGSRIVTINNRHIADLLNSGAKIIDYEPS